MRNITELAVKLQVHRISI
jgi:serine/threonine-protein phosphatase 2A regulatory subunit A